MTCETCGEKPKKCGNCNKDFPRAVIEINNPETLVLLRKVVIPASMGDEEQVPPAIGKYHNVILYYEANKHIYLYSSDGIPTLLETEVPQELLDRIEDLEEEFEEFKNSPDVVDIVATYANLQTYDTSSLSNNDIVRVLEDETHDGNSTYYRWNSQTETWTYVGEIDLSSAIFFYADPDETGDTRHIYKDETFTEEATIQDVLDAVAKGQVILRKITNSSVPRRLRYEDSCLARVNIADPTRPNPSCWLFFLGYDSYHDYLGRSLSDSSFMYTEHEFQGKLTAGQNITISSSNVISASGVTPVQSGGNSETDIMSQKATSNLLYNIQSWGASGAIIIDPTLAGAPSTTQDQDYGDIISIGRNASVCGSGSERSIQVGAESVSCSFGTALGFHSDSGSYSVALGCFSDSDDSEEHTEDTSGVVSVGNKNSTTYVDIWGDTQTVLPFTRRIINVKTPILNNDAATKGYVDSITPIITMQTTDPGEGQPLAANNFIGVYE